MTKSPRKGHSAPNTDAPILAQLLELHATRHPRILDCTYSTGRIWGHLPVQRFRMDSQPLPNLDLVGRWQDLATLFAPRCWDVIVWDPIHVTDVGRKSQIYNSWVDPELRGTGDNITADFPVFLAGARAVLQPSTGIVLAKIADMVHGGTQQMQFVGFVNAALADGWTVCDYDVRWRDHIPPPDSKHKVLRHVRKHWSFWIVLRNGPSCWGPGIHLKHECKCLVCGKFFKSVRSDAKTCSPAHRKRLQRSVATP